MGIMSGLLTKDQNDKLFTLFKDYHYCEGCTSWGCLLIRQYVIQENIHAKNGVINCPCTNCIVKMICRMYCINWFNYTKEVYPNDQTYRM